MHQIHMLRNVKITTSKLCNGLGRDDSSALEPKNFYAGAKPDDIREDYAI